MKFKRMTALYWARKNQLNFTTGFQAENLWEKNDSPLYPFIQAGMGSSKTIHFPIEFWENILTQDQRERITIAFDAFAVWRNDINGSNKTVGWEFNNLQIHQIEFALTKLVTGLSVKYV